jgi:hypothetical protein
MTKYTVVSPRVGTPGAEFDLDLAVMRGANIEALLAGGFIKVSAPKPVKNAKKDIDTNEE